ncbi:putative transcriptional regulator [Bernardetia litoralis DSM 6794]|uniref:Putative transcriptional regulator n=1 Tax=Bernardetia litoralis (strain ATCC 23117 / DSM 6794 / NBRC 15988 / NCIMB 1366 / Fx l1 / Sio-4) TaxID=880071 RepID=I4AJN1_BERLS|nr:helix-turn-helix transcriptional regulator [Bernardetia litoralis]AFM04166.1 putative transcriptional regulator [Bernardetia litoralis DSM 6794]
MFFSSNLRYLRRVHNLTQEALSNHLGVSLKKIGSYEEERATPKLEPLIEIANFFSVTLEQFINQDLSLESINKNTSELPELKKYAAAERLRVLSITQDRNENEYIELVRLDSEEDYIKGYSDIDFVAGLPKCQLPALPLNHTYRAFEISDSLLAAPTNSIVVGAFVADWNELKDNEPCIIVSENTGIVFRKIKNQIIQNDTLLLEDTNGQFSSYSVSVEDIEEIWRFAAYISLDFPQVPTQVNELRQTMQNLQSALEILEERKIKKKTR